MIHGQNMLSQSDLNVHHIQMGQIGIFTGLFGNISPLKKMFGRPISLVPTFSILELFLALGNNILPHIKDENCRQMKTEKN